MFRDVITPYTSNSDWSRIRRDVQDRIQKTLGKPLEKRGGGLEGVYGDERVAHGLRMRSLRFEAIPGFPTHGTLVGPSHCAPDEMRPGILCIHGTDETLAHRNVLSPVDKPNRAYAIELAQRGAVTLAVDQFGFGEGNAGRSQAEVVDSFYRKYPEGSLDGARLSVHQCAVDFLASHPLVDASRLGCMGHSLGGRAAVYLAALDPRIRACVSSAGISPNLTNGFRNRPRKDSFSPRLDDEMERTGKSAFEYQELLALIAPRAALLLEPWNDPYNPMIEPVFRCFEKARFVFQLCGVPENLQILCHGEGHDTLPDIRNYAYAWLLKKLGVVE